MLSRSCKQCGGYHDQTSYSKNQWGKGVGQSRFNGCIHGGSTKLAGRAAETRRLNRSQRATFTQYDLDNPFASGAFRWVAKGVYTEGSREDEQCVTKWFKTGVVFEALYFALDIKASEKSCDLIQQWNAAGFTDKIIRMNMPEVWEFVDSGQKCLQEPFIEEWQKFNSNSGWADDSTPWPRVMQALSHFTYHASGGQFVLCDLQGGVYSDGVVLTDPVILSRSKSFGVTDLGPNGISNFFAKHQCNEFCRSRWSKPANMGHFFEAQEGTSMMDEGSQSHVQTRDTRQQMSAFAEEDSNSDY